MTFIAEEDLVMEDHLVACLMESGQVVLSFLTAACTSEAQASSSECGNDSDSSGEVPCDVDLLEREAWVTWLMRGA